MINNSLEEKVPLYHKPVMVDEVLMYLDPKPKKLYCDVTFGSGGHTQAILNVEPESSVVALDWDMLSVETYAPVLEEKYEGRLRVLWGNFSHLYRILKKAHIDKVDGILADFGTSMMHFKERSGFSFYKDSPLDMRMSPSHQRITAAYIVNKSSEEKLRELFYQLGEEKNAKKIANAIVKARAVKEIKTTRELAETIERVVPKKPGTRVHPATKVFQALRMYVNKELDNIHGFLSGALQVLRPGGYLVCISFHSLEDRVVKQFFKQKADEGVVEILTKKVVIPSKEEIAHNPSARSAKLRAIRFLG